MTTITYRDGIMAGDRRISDTGRGLIEGGTTKIFRREDDGALIGVAGSLGVAQRFARWFLAGEQGEMPPLRDKDANATAEAIVVRPNGKVENIYELGTIYIESDYHAIGSGSIAALAAMDMGADARRAVEVACGRDAGSGNGIDELRLDLAIAAHPPAPPTVSDSGEGEALDKRQGMTRRLLLADGSSYYIQRGLAVPDWVSNIGYVEANDEDLPTEEDVRGILSDTAAPETAPAPILQDKDKDEEAGEGDLAKLRADLAGLDMLEDPADGLLHDKALIVDDTPTIPRSEIPQGAAVETFTDAGVETVKLSGITHIVDDAPERVAETQPEAAYAPIHNVDEPATPEQLAAAGIIEPGASEMAAMRTAKSKPSFIERVLGIPPTPKQTAEEGV